MAPRLPPIFMAKYVQAKGLDGRYCRKSLILMSRFCKDVKSLKFLPFSRWIMAFLLRSPEDGTESIAWF